jgi:hypothetical protein
MGLGNEFIFSAAAQGLFTLQDHFLDVAESDDLSHVEKEKELIQVVQTMTDYACAHIEDQDFDCPEALALGVVDFFTNDEWAPTALTEAFSDGSNSSVVNFNKLKIEKFLDNQIKVINHALMNEGFNPL